MAKRSYAFPVAASFSPRLRAIPWYTVSETELEVGASLGNSAVWVNTKSTGAIERVFSLDRGTSFFGSVIIRYAGSGAVPKDASSEDAASTYIALEHDAPATVELHPVFSRRRFSIGGAVSVTETTFVPLTNDLCDPPVAFVASELRSTDDCAHNLRVTAFARLRGNMSDDIVAHFDDDISGLVAWNESDRDAVRVFGLDVAPTRYATSFNFGSVTNPSHQVPLKNDTSARGDVLGALQLDISLQPGSTFNFCVMAGAYNGGQPKRSLVRAQLAGWESALKDSESHMEDMLDKARVLTPDISINHGALWSKVNMRRVMGTYPQGPAFTNEPGMSSNVVMRDAAWFIFGCDHFKPDFSRALLEKFAALQYPDGKIAEYYNAIDGRREDYGLNINDDTPLFIMAVNHHFRSSGDTDWLKSIYPSVTRAAECMIAQLDDRGLVVCTAADPRGNVWGIAGWRNIIENYCVNGAVTEINAECAAALRAAGHLAENIDRPKQESKKWFDAGERVRAAMDEHLRNPENGLYYLNIDLDGNVHTDVTGDQVFPVMLRVCDEETGYRIISRLNAPDFWTEAGLRTASRNDARYDPSANNGLIGGVWPGLTWWYAFAAARYHPEFMMRALRSSFQHFAADPKLNNTIPGQFSEWFDGESLINRGMRLSPWEPPRFLWAAVEGLCGLMLTPKEPHISPVIPRRWGWVGVRRICYHGEEISFFATRQNDSFVVYVTGAVETDSHAERYEKDVSDDATAFSAVAAVIAFSRRNAFVVLVGNVSDETASIPLNIAKLVNADSHYRLRIYNGERDAWEEEVRKNGRALASLAVTIEAHGFRLIEVQNKR
ncbi:MAG TPA: amylo-alpha-1,6-glucosidase [Candidatus Eremiobacteraceae bacterium]|nr:amylo-alpha-1,6-glucosidase [Candidatus Eremiobacteraceae bacterium]